MANAKKAPTAAETVEAAVAAVSEPVAKFQEQVRAGAEKGLEQVRVGAEKGLEQVRAAYAQVKTQSENATATLEDTLNLTQKGARDLNLQVVNFVRSNNEATFAHIEKLLAVKNPSDLFSLNSGFLRAQIETLTAQSREYSELAKKVTTEALAPAKALADKAISR